MRVLDRGAAIGASFVILSSPPRAPAPGRRRPARVRPCDRRPGPRSVGRLPSNYRLDLRRSPRVALESVALRQQLATLKRSVKRPQLRARDRAFWILLAKVWR